MRGIDYFSSEYVIKQPLAISTIERSLAREHLKDQGSQGPPIHRFSMSLLGDNLWCEVLRRATEGMSRVIYNVLLAESEISDLSKPFFVD